MLNPNAKKWVEALRSGKFEQTKGWLNNGGKFCCLGVGCELAREDGLDLELGSFDSVTVYDNCAAILPKKVQLWLGLRGDLGRFKENDGKENSLSSLNDTYTPFAEIADVIESEPEGLFA